MTSKRSRRVSLIADAFADLLQDITPTDQEFADALGRYDAIKACLNSGFWVSEVRLVGSFAKRTAVRGQSDLDVFACLARDEARWGDRDLDSRTFLRRVRDQLQHRYPTTDIRTARQAVSLRFTKGVNRFDVVPAVFARMTKGGAVFGIPDGTGDWLLTAPHVQTRELREAAKRSGGKLPRVIQLIKWWTRVRARAVPLNSFHLEMVLAGKGLGVGAGSYAALTAHALRVLARRQGRALTDPSGISNLIPAVSSEAQKQLLTTQLRQSAQWADEAVRAEDAGDVESAFEYWNKVFNGRFA
jgi:hypothetical protein